MDRREFMATTAAAGVALMIPQFGPFRDTPESAERYYSALADALDKLPNAFPRTESKIELAILRKIFTREEAWLAGQMTIAAEPVSEIAERVGLSEEETTRRLGKLSNKGAVWGRGGKYRLAPFIVGIYEEQLWTMDHELAHLMEDYMDESGAEFMRYQPAIHRVIPAQSAVKTDWILPYDDVKKVIMASASFRVRDCICRVQQDLLKERKCDLPLRVCLNFTPFERPATARDISKKEALELLDESERVGLVHCVTNIEEGFYYVCNCCGCCCGILRGITEFGIDNSVAAANYFAAIDPEACQGCGICVERCHMKAIAIHEGIAVVDREKCIGCGLCVTGCALEGVRLERKPEKDVIHPPGNFNIWEEERLKSRGLT
jgi:NAD-dependent dihydropyrimidine dehydrogenase PreA subunit/DNA-binding Lrp family transcriptional regulator